METHGRTVIKANYTEEQLLKGSIDQIKERVLKIVKDSIPYHEQNATESKYLIDYEYGIQDIRFKEKHTRTEINNKSVENWAYAMIDWKKTFLLGRPVMYAPIKDVGENQINVLNTYTSYESKNIKDLEIWDNVLACGRGFRYIKSSPVNDEDESPFNINNIDPLKCEVVYSSGIDGEQLLSYVVTSQVLDNFTFDTNEKVIKNEQTFYDEYTVYTRKFRFVINNKYGTWNVENEVQPIYHNEHSIVEYYLNPRRMGIIELGKDIFDDINRVENLDLDDIESFVNAIMVFTNAEVDEEGMEEIKKFGAVSIKSTDQKQAKVELLQSRLKSLDTQIFYLRKISALHDILSIPQANNSGMVNNAETGKATLTGQGFTSASVRIEGEELKFKECDKKCLKAILKICKNKNDTGITNLKVSDIEIKLNRDLSDNLVSKTTALVNLATAQIPPAVRNQVVGLFSDPVSVTKMQEKFIEEQRNLTNELNKLKNQENINQDSEELDIQSQ